MKATDTKRTVFLLRNRYKRMLVELFRENPLQPFADSVREYDLMKEEHLYDEDICIKFLQSGFFKERCRPTCVKKTGHEIELSFLKLQTVCVMRNDCIGFMR